MKIGVYPFASTGSIDENLLTIRTGIEQAAAQNVRLLVFHECALCGYPPVESDISKITPEIVENALSEIASLSQLHTMYIAVGTVRFEDTKRFNSLVLFSDSGQVVGCYDKTTLWGWDTENFEPGQQSGLFEIDGLQIGFRICFDVRFPECFRSLYQEGANLCIVAFSDTSKTADPERYEIIKSHLRTRAVENVMTVISVNSLARHVTAPTAVFDPNGRVLAEASTDHPNLLVYDYEIPETTFGMQGRIENTNRLMNTHR